MVENVDKTAQRNILQLTANLTCNSLNQTMVNVNNQSSIKLVVNSWIDLSINYQRLYL